MVCCRSKIGRVIKIYKNINIKIYKDIAASVPLTWHSAAAKKGNKMDEKITIEIDKFIFDKLLEYQKESKSDDIEETIIKAICMARYNYKKRSELKC